MTRQQAVSAYYIEHTLNIQLAPIAQHQHHAIGVDGVAEHLRDLKAQSMAGGP
jgi:hypothetical protein